LGWVVRVTDEQAAVGALAQIENRNLNRKPIAKKGSNVIAKKGSNVVVGSKKVVTRKLDASSALRRLF